MTGLYPPIATSADRHIPTRRPRRICHPEPMTDTGVRPDAYPVWWEADVVLRDGSVAHVRPIVPNDADALRRFHARQSPESIYLRFFAPLKVLSDKDVARFRQVDYDQRVD